MSSPNPNIAPQHNPGVQPGDVEQHSNMYLNANIAMQGIARGINTIRGTLAIARKENAERKFALYTHLGEIALQSGGVLQQTDVNNNPLFDPGITTIDSAGKIVLGYPIPVPKKDFKKQPIPRKRTTSITYMGETPTPRTPVERFMDKRLDKKDSKQFTALVYRESQLRNSGGSNTKRSTLKTFSALRDVNKEYKSGAISSEEMRVKKLKAYTTPEPKQLVETKMQKRTRRDLEKATSKERRVANRSIAQKVREIRLKHSAKVIDKTREKVNARNEKITELRLQKNNPNNISRKEQRKVRKQLKKAGY